VNIKHDILKTLQAPIAVLRVRYGIRSTDTVGVLRALARRGRLDGELAARLEQTLATAQRLRVSRHLELGAKDDRLGQITPETQGSLRRMAPDLVELNRVVERLDLPRRR